MVNAIASQKIQLVSYKHPRICAKEYKFVPPVGSEPNFLRIVYYSDTALFTACSLVLVCDCYMGSC